MVASTNIDQKYRDLIEKFEKGVNTLNIAITQEKTYGDGKNLDYLLKLEEELAEIDLLDPGVGNTTEEKFKDLESRYGVLKLETLFVQGMKKDSDIF